MKKYDRNLICINNDGREDLTLGKTYAAKLCSPPVGLEGFDDVYELLNDSGRRVSAYLYRFEEKK